MIAPDPKQRFLSYDELCRNFDAARRALEFADARRHSSHWPFSGLFGATESSEQTSRGASTLDEALPQSLFASMFVCTWHKTHRHHTTAFPSPEELEGPKITDFMKQNLATTSQIGGQLPSRSQAVAEED